ncbi:MAG TPA: nitrite reductase small subunit NirD [Candidatus Solibacter sp.]|nr:nitrite reductase small subunit NirD [Candidatus Solibacter sp.]
MSHTNTWVRIAYCRDIPLREGRAAKVGNREIAIFNLGDRFLAVDNHCPHKGGPLADGLVSGTTVVCPLHAWRLSLDTGKGVNGPSASSCVETFPTRVEFGVVLLDICNIRTEGGEPSRKEVPALCVQPGEIAGTNDYSSAAEA